MRIALVVAILLLSCKFGVCTESPRQIIPPKSIKSDQATNKQQYGTDEFPFVVKTVKPPKTKEETDSDADDRKDRKALNNFTLALVAVGTLQFFALILQVIFLCKTLRSTEKAANAAKKSANVAEEALTVFERPYIFVSNIGPFQFDKIKEEFFVTYKMVNHGRTPAEIDYICAGMSNIETDIKKPMHVESEHGLYISPILEAGGMAENLRQSFPINSGMYWDIQEENITPKLASTDDFYFRVVVTYRGLMSETYEDSFFWVYDRSAKAFTPRRDAEYYYKKKY